MSLYMDLSDYRQAEKRLREANKAIKKFNEFEWQNDTTGNRERELDTERIAAENAAVLAFRKCVLAAINRD